MEGLVQYISEFSQFKELIFSILEDSLASEILISGICARMILGEIVDKITDMNLAGGCKIIVPNVINREGLSKPQINRIDRQGGEVRVNGSISSNIIVIDDNAFVIACSYKYNKEHGVKTFFESCMATNCGSVVETIKNTFYEKWNRSFPLKAEYAGEDSL